MGKGGNASGARPAAASSDGATEVLIEGSLYDVRGFKHPGGSIVKFLTGAGDATDAFREFHGRSPTAKKMLKALPHREAPKSVAAGPRAHNGKEALSKDFAEMRAGLERDGFFEPSAAHAAYRLAEIAAMHVLGAYLFLTGASALVKFAGVAVLGLASGRCGWLMHEGGHYSMTTNIAADRALQIFLYGTGCGMSGMWWRNQHNKHHATPQKLKHDVDLDTLPLMAFNAEVTNKVSSPLMKAWLRKQGYMFIPVSCLLVALGWQYYLHPRHILRTMTSTRAAKGYPKQAVGEAAAIVLRHVLFALLFQGYSAQAKVGLYLVYNFFASSYIFTNFSLSHTHLPVTKADEYLHWVEYAAKHTTNLAPSFACDWWMAYLNYQIEHHLFPSMPQFRHPETSKRVKVLFQKHGLHYDVRPYFSCLRETLENLQNVGHEVAAKGTAKKAL